jgi:rhamnose transport system permease protein
VRKTRARAFPFWHEVGLAALLLGVLLTARVLAPDFVAADAQAELLTHVWEAALLAIPMTLVILTGGIDLSVGSIMALSAVTFGLAFRSGWPLVVALLAALLVGAAAGALNGVFVARVRVHPLLVTLATLAAYRGVAEGISRGEPISGFPSAFTAALTRGGGGLTAAGVLFLSAALVAAFALARTTWGLHLFATGNNEEATRFSGVNVARLKMVLYTLNGLAASIAAILFVSRRNTAKADVGLGLELEVITMVVLGGTSIFGGRGGIVGTVLGVLLLHETREFVSWQWHRDELNLIVVGTLLILSVLLNQLLTPRGRDER